MTNSIAEPFVAAATNLATGVSEAVSNAVTSVASASPNSANPPAPDGGGFPWTASALVLAAAAVVFAVFRKPASTHPSPTTNAGSSDPKTPSPAPDAKPTAERTAKPTVKPDEGIVDDILAAISPDASADDPIRAELAAMLSGATRPSDPRLADILRVEESFEKRPGRNYLRRVSILRRKEGTTGSLAKVESELGWEYVPDAVRGEFIRTRQDRIVRLVYDAGKAGKA